MMLLALLLAAQTAPAGCADGLRVEVDRASFPAPGRTMGPARTDRIGRLALDRVEHAADALCDAHALRPDRIAGFTTLRVQNGDGAIDPIFYADPDSDPATLTLQYAYGAGDGASEKAIGEALLCWAKPRRQGCYSR